MEITKFIDKQLERYRNSSTNKLEVSDNFVLAYGPYMCMAKGLYERECDEIARYNKWMSIMVHAAYLIRKITSGVSYRDAKKIIKDFNLSNYLTFANSSSENDNDIYVALHSFSNSYLSKIRSEQKEKGAFESFITTATPIVPYKEMVKRPDQLGTAEEMTRVDIANHLPKNFTDDSIRNEITSLLLNNLAEIMMNYELCTVLVFNSIYEKANWFKLDDLLVRDSSVSFETQKYYFLATVNFYGMHNSPEFGNYLHFFEEAGDFSKMQSYSTFEAMVNTMANATNTDIAAESWDDPSLDAKEEEAISQIVNSHNKYSKDIIEEAKYDFGALNDYINVKRFMSFEEFPNRLFLGSLEKSRVVNINNIAIILKLFKNLDIGILDDNTIINTNKKHPNNTYKLFIKNTPIININNVNIFVLGSNL